MYGKDTLNIRTKGEKWANRSIVLHKYSKYTELITITNTGHGYWQMVKLLKQKQFLWISYPDLPAHSEQLSWGKEREGGKKRKNPKNQLTNQPSKTNKLTNRKSAKKQHQLKRVLKQVLCLCANIAMTKLSPMTIFLCLANRKLLLEKF